MSDQVSNAEIEDVLDSIRRLIQTDDKSSDQAANKGDKLVLSQAQRVHDGVLVEAKHVPSDINETSETVLKLTDPVALTDPMSDDQDEHDSAQVDEVLADLEGLEEAMTADIETLDISSPRVTPDGAVDEDQIVDTPVFPPVDGDQQLEDRIAELEAAVIATSGSWEPDEGEVAKQSEVLSFHAQRRMSAAADSKGDAEPPHTEPVLDVSQEQATQPATEQGSADKSTDIDVVGDQGAEGVVETAPDLAKDASDRAEVAASVNGISQDDLRELIREIVREEVARAAEARVGKRTRRLLRVMVENALNERDVGMKPEE